MDVKIIEVAPVSIAVLEHRGDPMTVNNTVAKFIEWRKASGLSDYTVRGTYGIPYNDPLVTPGEDFRFDVCGELNPESVGHVPENPQGVVVKSLPGGRCAVVRHVVPGADHTFNSLPWELQVLALMLDWFRCNFSC